ncbi:beta-ketoacyl synthase N-terminal-like domain-containing protein [Pseudoalteromonas sp. S16_S37]|uniref:beta-ketoacyl synthase N-terminal-like domain-containing protein n=1 Tax=Pseudoalteromonas sp. S16_S37 TaxID=2720228 RepID=UPI001680E46C|nr:polyketide synthase [Pseudoalteromonas sp. S16_S37]MBD1580779.1 hypothetical protein [Pseudoalteromonas sp. S16_S37]
METVTGLEVAIVGMATRVPGANSIDEYWQNLLAGKDILKMQQQRYPDQSGNLGGVLDNVHGFDAAFFDVAAREACLMDPQLRQSLEVSWHALEDAGLINQRTGAHIGVFAGAPTSAYLTYGISNKDKLDSAVEIDELIHHNSQELFASKLAYQLGVNGPALSLTTGCSTSFVLLHYACLALNSGDCETALVVASRIGYPHYEGYTATPGGPLSPDGLCRPFANNATGMVPGSGALAVVLKRYEEALEDGDRIYAVIRGSALNNDGRDKLGFAAPSVNGQAQVAKQAMMNADIEPHEVAYVEAHGTGTELGDGVELRALQQAYGEAAPSQSCALGSVKGNIGHLDAASGLASLVKVSLMLHHRTLLPTINCDDPLEQLQSPSSRFYVQREVTPWPESKPLIAGLNIFGIGGTNGHVLLQNASAVPLAASEHNEQVLFLSAKDPQALLRNRDALLAWLRNNPQCNLKQLSWSLLNCKEPMLYRSAVSVSSLQDFQALKAITSDDISKAQGAPIISIEAITSDDLIVLERLFDSDDALNTQFKRYLGESSAELDAICKSPSLWHELRIKMADDPSIERLLNRAVWLSVLARLSQMGLALKNIHARGALFISAAQWAGVLNSSQALSLLNNQSIAHVESLPNQARCVLTCNDSAEPLTAKYWQQEAFWQALCESKSDQQLRPLSCSRLVVDASVHRMAAQLWMQGVAIDSDAHFGEKFAPLSLPGYAFASTRFKLPLHKLESTRWQMQQWSKVAQQDDTQQQILLLMPKGEAAKKVQHCFGGSDKNVWYIYCASQFSVSNDNMLYADLTQQAHLEQIESHIQQQISAPCSWVDARLSAFTSKPEDMLNAMVDVPLRRSWQALDAHLQDTNSRWAQLCLIPSESAYNKCAHLGRYIFDFFSYQYQDLALGSPPKTLWCEVAKNATKVPQTAVLSSTLSSVLSSTLLSQAMVAKASQFKIMHKQLFCLTHSRFNPSGYTPVNYNKALLLGIEQPNGVAIASTLPALCEHIHVVLPADFPAQQQWQQWLLAHVEGNLYSKIILLLTRWLEEGIACSWHNHKANRPLHKQPELLCSDICINLVATENAFSQPENLLMNVEHQAAYTQLLTKLMAANPLLCSLVLLHGPCTAGLTSNARLWHQAAKNCFSSVVLANQQITAEDLGRCFSALSQPTHKLLVDDMLVSHVSSATLVKQTQQSDEQQYAPRPELAQPFVEPTTPLERQIAQIWQSYFYLSPIGRDDDFFSLHGHSLLALKIVNRINEQHATQLTLQDVLENPTIAKLSELVSTNKSAASEGAE